MNSPLLHPCELDDEKLLAECDAIRQRRSGPGGQHRNKVETAIRLQHRATGLTAQASERRSQAENQKQALWRLRLELALSFRSLAHHVAADESQQKLPEPSVRWSRRTASGKLSVNPQHGDFPPLLAELLDLLSLTEWDHKPIAAAREISASQLVKFLSLEPRALKLLNDQRGRKGLKPLT